MNARAVATSVRDILRAECDRIVELCSRGLQNGSHGVPDQHLCWGDPCDAVDVPATTDIGLCAACYEEIIGRDF